MIVEVRKMTNNQTERHELGRAGEAIAKATLGGRATNHKAPLDIVDFTAGYGYEVKAISGLSKDLKIHIANKSMARKKAFTRKYGLKLMLIAVVIYDPDHIEMYRSALKQSIRISQMKRIG